MARDARDLTTLWRDIEEVTDALEAAVAQLVRSSQPHEKLVEALIIDLQRLQKDCVAVRHLSAQQQKQYMAHNAAQQQRRMGQQQQQQQQQQQRLAQQAALAQAGAPAAMLQAQPPPGLMQQAQQMHAQARSLLTGSAQHTLQRQHVAPQMQPQSRGLAQPVPAARQQLTDKQQPRQQQPPPA